MSNNLIDLGVASSKEYSVKQNLGRGRFGDVLHVERIWDKKQLVIKKLDQQFFAGQGPHVLEIARQEAISIRTLRHPHIVSVFNYFQGFLSNLYIFKALYNMKIEHSSHNLVLEYCPGGDLQTVIDRRKEGDFFPEVQILDWTLQLTVALKYLHTRSILHHNINAKHVLMTNDQRLIKLGDFGAAKIVEKTGSAGTSQVSEPNYTSPEVCHGQPYTPKSEAWSLGVLIYNLAALKPPFHGLSVYYLYRAITESSPQPLPYHFSPEIKDFICKLIVKNPNDRLFVVEAADFGQRFLLPVLSNLSAASVKRRSATLSKFGTAEAPISPSSDGYKDISAAAIAGRLDVVKYFVIKKGVGVDVKDEIGRTALHSASLAGKLEVVKWLINEGANAKMTSGNSDGKVLPIHLAAYFGHLPVVKYLIEVVDAEMALWANGEGRLPIHTASVGGQIGVLRYLIFDRNVDINAKDGQLGRTALHCASENGRVDVVKWLVAAGADKRATSKDANLMPIHIAAWQGELDVVKYFVNTFPELKTVKDSLGRSPLTIAKLRELTGCRHIKHFLKQ